MHDLVLILCSLFIYAGTMWGCTRIATAIGQFSITITPIREKSVEDMPTPEVKIHG